MSHVSYVEDEGIPLYEDDEGDFGPELPVDNDRYGGKPKHQAPKRPFEVMLDVYPLKNKGSSAQYDQDDYYRQDASNTRSGQDRNNGHHVVLHLNLYAKKPTAYFR